MGVSLAQAHTRTRERPGESGHTPPMLRWLALACVLPATWAAAQPLSPPTWAFPVPTGTRTPTPDDGKPRHVSDSKATFTVPQTRDQFFSPDWHPEDHPPMPPIVAVGRKPDVAACGFCHRASGAGGPENSSLSGLPRDYLVRQLQAYRAGDRTSALPDRVPAKMMIALAKALTDEEIDAAATYFAAVRPRPKFKVVETQTIPTPTIRNWTWTDAKTGEREPLGDRIIEMPDDFEVFELRDARATFTTFVPVGSLARGAELAVACQACHGPTFNGQTVAPPLAGRSASYAMRQLYEFKTGARQSGNAALMKPVVEKLSLDDLRALAAYLASLPP